MSVKNWLQIIGWFWAFVGTAAALILHTTGVLAASTGLLIPVPGVVLMVLVT